MMSSPWSLTEGLAQLDIEPFHATIDLHDPSKGLFDVRGSERVPIGLLGLHRPTNEPFKDSLRECFVRGPDLLANYRAQTRWPIDVDVVWRITEPDHRRVLATIDLILSISTELLDAQPMMEVVSRFPATNVLRLIDSRSGRFDKCHGSDTEVITPKEGPGCFLLRSASTGLSYAEMIHPANFFQSETTRTTELHHQIFPNRIEKGLILRARLRGLLIPQSEDTQTAAACYAAFASDEPPLGT